MKQGFQTNLDKIIHTTKNYKICWKGRVWIWRLHWVYNGIDVSSWQGESTYERERHFYKQNGDKNAGPWRREVLESSPLLQNNAKYGLNEKKY